MASIVIFIQINESKNRNWVRRVLTPFRSGDKDEHSKGYLDGE